MTGSIYPAIRLLVSRSSRQRRCPVITLTVFFDPKRWISVHASHTGVGLLLCAITYSIPPSSFRPLLLSFRVLLTHRYESNDEISLGSNVSPDPRFNVQRAMYVSDHGCQLSRHRGPETSLSLHLGGSVSRPRLDMGEPTSVSVSFLSCLGIPAYAMAGVWVSGIVRMCLRAIRTCSARRQSDWFK
ncbi:hypothetical protein B0H21DRAFT_222467 [Amylocystis lapponica]|nr:hypothetical protein B0H21DRAFT_222467 [Amylocystis lapponica]